jgi:hypothetical protein
MERHAAVVQRDSDPGTGALLDLCTKGAEEGFDVSPADVCANRVFEDCRKSAGVFRRNHCQPTFWVIENAAEGATISLNVVEASTTTLNE